MESKKRGRPPSGKYNISEMVKIIENYIAIADESHYPILKELCLREKWNYDYIMELQGQHEELSQSIKRLYMKREVMLELGGLSGKYKTAFAIFILSQPVHGWKNRQSEETLIGEESTTYKFEMEVVKSQHEVADLTERGK